MATTYYQHAGVYYTALGFPAVNDVYTQGATSFRITAVVNTGALPDDPTVGGSIFNVVVLSGALDDIPEGYYCDTKLLVLQTVLGYFSIRIIHIASSGTGLEGVTGLGLGDSGPLVIEVGGGDYFVFDNGYAFLPWSYDTPVLSGYTFSPTTVTYTWASNSEAAYVTIEGTPIPTPPSQATNPNPANAATGVLLSQATLSWTGDGDSYKVYFGTNPATWTYTTTTSATLTMPVALSYNTTYYWRVDSINEVGTTTGVTWSFTTELLVPPDLGAVYRHIVVAAANTIWYES